MPPEARTCLLIADFTIDNFAGYLNNDRESPAVDAVVAPPGPVGQTLARPPTQTRDICCVWTRPQGAIPSFNKRLMYEAVPAEQILEEVDQYTALLLAASENFRSLFVPTWQLPTFNRGCGMIDMRSEIGIANTLMKMNLRLADGIGEAANIFLLNAQKWIEEAGFGAFVPKLWYMGKIAFGDQVFAAAAKDLKAALRGLGGMAKKLLAVDLDNTLWGDVVGEVGWEKIRLGGHDHVGEAFADFQKALKALTNRGILLGIVSKNEESVALEAIRKHPEMMLGLDDFSGWRINWRDKAQNLVDLVAELNIGLHSVVFIDDDPVERTRVREALPEVMVPEWPQDQTLYASTLTALPCFDAPSFSAEDSSRGAMYASERQRQERKKSLGSLDEWLHTLELKVKIEGLNAVNLPRAGQLLNKTNQMNLTTRRMVEGELADWAARENNALWVFYVADKFGDSGLTGIASLEVRGGRGRIVDFVLSCRAMGRKVEETMLYHLFRHARDAGLEEVYADYVQSPRNKPCGDFFCRTLPRSDAVKNRYYWKLERDFPLPSHIEIALVGDNCK